jgi:peptide/nickel transport system substrate-binding protein
MEENYWTRRRRYSRRSVIRGMGIAAGAAALAPVIAACGSSKSNKNANTAATAARASAAAGTAAAAATPKPVKGGTFTFGMTADITTFDILKIQDAYSNYAVSNMTNSLVRYDHNLKAVPSLAASWENPDDHTYVFKLQPNVTFQDGSPFNADAVKFNLDRHIQDKASVRHSDVADVTDVSVVDPTTVKLTLGHPNAPFLTKLSGGAGTIYSPTAVQKLGDKIGTDFTGIGTGPYKFVEWVKGDHFTAVRNDTYWEKDAAGTQLPYFDKIILKVIPDENVRLQNLKSGGVDAIDSPPVKDVASIKQDPTLQYMQEPGLGFGFIMVEVEKPPFSTKEIRQALSYAIDRQQIVHTVLFDVSIPADTVIPPGVLGDDPNYHPYLKQDINKAKQLLQGAGQTKLSFPCQISSGSPTVQQTFELIKDQITPAGFDMQISSIQFSELVANGNSGNYQVGGGISWGGGLDPDGDVYSLFYTKAGFNLSHYSNPTLDALMDKGRQTLDAQARAPIYQQIEKILAEDLPFIVTTHPVSSATSTKKVQNWLSGVRPVQGFSQVWKTA